jgi:probable addiction module antidote protein
MKLKDFDQTLQREFNDPKFIALYLQTTLEEEGVEGFLVALGNVIRVTEGMTKISQEAELGRESLYKALSLHGNPQFSTVYKVIGALGLEFSFKPSETHVL